MADTKKALTKLIQWWGTKCNKVTIEVNEDYFLEYTDTCECIKKNGESTTLRHPFQIQEVIDFLCDDIRDLRSTVDDSIDVDDPYINRYNLNFDFGKSTIRESSFPTLDKLAQTLIEAKNWKIDIDGHTDDKGSDSFNQKLSQDRANAVKSYLVSKGVPADSIIATGFGETKPIVKNDSDTNRERNRRVEFKITKPNNEVITVKA